MNRLILNATCPDQPGIIARFTALLFEQGANILSLEQRVEADTGLSRMRLEADLTACRVSASVLQGRIRILAESLEAQVVFE